MSVLVWRQIWIAGSVSVECRKGPYVTKYLNEVKKRSLRQKILTLMELVGKNLQSEKHAFACGSHSECLRMLSGQILRARKTYLISIIRPSKQKKQSKPSKDIQPE
jgi:hypothetical protein